MLNHLFYSFKNFWVSGQNRLVETLLGQEKGHLTFLSAGPKRRFLTWFFFSSSFYGIYGDQRSLCIFRPHSVEQLRYGDWLMVIEGGGGGGWEEEGVGEDCAVLSSYLQVCGVLEVSWLENWTEGLHEPATQGSNPVGGGSANLHSRRDYNYRET